MYVNYCKKLQQTFVRDNIKPRPDGRTGLWITILLPLAIIQSSIQYPQSYFVNYRICSIFCIYMLITTITFVYGTSRIKHLDKRSFPYILLWIIFSMVNHFLTRTGLLFSIYGAFLSSVFYKNLHVYLIKNVQQAFTYGEASIVAQSISLLLYTLVINLSKYTRHAAEKNLEISNIVLQVGLIGIGLICLLTYLLPFLRRPMVFYAFFCVGTVTFILVPLHIILKHSPLLWIVDLLIADLKSAALIVYWILCCMLTAFVVNRQIDSKKRATTIARKTFHFLAIAIFLPGLLYKCTIMYLASGVVLGIFIAIELVRIIQLPALADNLQAAFSLYCDEKDAGGLALTPIYLLVGFAAPLWLHPTPCDLTDSAGYNILPLLSGICTIGVGDSGASYFGTRFGRHKWPSTKKTVEGTIGCVVSQAAFIYLVYLCGIIGFHHSTLYKFIAAVFVTSFVEAFTTQVDNLILPLICYIITI